MLPTHRRTPQWSSKRPFLPRSKLSWLLALTLGTITLYSFYYLSPPDTPWNRRPGHFRPPPPSSHGHSPPDAPFDNHGLFDDQVKSGPQPEESITPGRLLWQSRALAVKSAFLHAWNGYELHAWGIDELRPMTEGSVQNFNGWGVSIVDSLDTLLLMDLRPQFARAMEHVAAMNFSQPPRDSAPFFETTIRYLGGLLSAYALVVDDGATSALTWQPEAVPYQRSSPESVPSNDLADDLEKRFEGSDARHERNRMSSILLSRAEHLARSLLPAFNTTSGLPVYGVNTASGKKTSTYSSLLAEIGSCQMEYKYLAHITGRREYFDVVNNVTTILEKLQQKQMKDPLSTVGGMLPTRYSVSTGEPQDQSITVGALADSAYEYFLKGYLMSGRSEPRLLDMYLASVNTALHNLTYVSTQRELVYITDANARWPTHKMEHLSCFYPGLLALGVELLHTPDTASGNLKTELPADVRERHRWASEAIAETCWIMYADNPTGLGSEEIVFDRPMIPRPPPAATVAENPNKPLVASPPSSQNSRVQYIAVDADYNRWWDVVDRWDQQGRSDGKAPGVQGASREVIITNGGKASWEVYSASVPAENETPLPTNTVLSETDGISDHSNPPVRPQHQRTHLRDYSVRDGRWLMRPETIESLYLLYRLTGDPIWRDRCYSIFQGLEKHSRTETGYASVRDIDYEEEEASEMGRDPGTSTLRGRPSKEDSMPSYALAETFKYLYLCMLEPEESSRLLPSQSWIFNTEAHPLPVFKWTEREMAEWDIR